MNFESLLTRRTVAAGMAGAAGTVLLSPAIFAQDATPAPYTAPDNIAELTGSIEADGSSTVGPLTEAVIEEFAAIAPGVSITNGISGTGGGFKRFAAGEIPISNASRPIAEDEIAATADAGIDWFEFEVAYDGITVVVSAENEFVETLTVEQLASLWAEDGGIVTWADLNPDWPADPIELYGPGADSGTFDFFNEVILEERAPRTDYIPSEDDNVLVEGVAGSPNALGYFGFAYFEANSDALRAVPIDAGAGPIEPSVESIADKSYSPLSRPLLIYVTAEAVTGDPAVQEFLRFYLANSGELASDVGYVSLPGDIEVAQQQKLEGAISGDLEPDSVTGATPAA